MRHASTLVLLGEAPGYGLGMTDFSAALEMTRRGVGYDKAGIVEKIVEN